MNKLIQLNNPIFSAASLCSQHNTSLYSLHWKGNISSLQIFTWLFSVVPLSPERRSGSQRTNSIPAEGAGSGTPSDLRELLERDLSEEKEIRLPRHLLCRKAPNLCRGNNKTTEGWRLVNGTPGRLSWMYDLMLHKSSLSSSGSKKKQ